jgi:MoaA/NifB/PqqE/SkfB family radical SAM enzyme
MFRVPVVDIYLTGACNLGCQYCFGEQDSKPGMEQSVFLRALDFAESVGARSIEFCGGEPLLYRDFERAVNLGLQRGFGLILRTNGLLLAKHRSLVASNFSAVGISLDGDPHSNDVMRPLKGSSHMTAEDKFRVPIAEIAALKALNPEIHIVLASVATSRNIDGLTALARILVTQRIKIDLWKVYQFVPNNFRAKTNSRAFLLGESQFKRLAIELAADIGGAFPVVCRTTEQIDGSCVVVNRDGDILLGSKTLGNVRHDDFAKLGDSLAANGAVTAVTENKQLTYGHLRNRGSNTGTHG